MFLNSQNIKIAQYRNKSGFNIKQDLEILKKYFKGTLIINDYIEFIKFANGLHLGQEDLEKFSSNKKEAIKIVKKKIGSKILGISTHNLKEIKEANKFEIDYIGLGAYRATKTKKDALIKGKKLLEISKSSSHPVAIIGGVKVDDNFSNYPNIKYKVIGNSLIKLYLNSRK